MNGVDTTRGVISLPVALDAFGRRLAALTGALVALASLIADAPVHVASLRGAVACVAIVALTRVGEWLCERTSAVPAAEIEDDGVAAVEHAPRPGR